MSDGVSEMVFSQQALELDPAVESARIIDALQTQIFRQLRRKGAVLGLSGGVDSSVTAALCARALGPERVLGILMPERESSDESVEMGQALADRLGIETVLEDITEVLEAAGCYGRRDRAVAEVFPDYGPGYKSKVVLPDLFGEQHYRVSFLVVQTPAGEILRKRIPPTAYQEIVAATNFKQRVRKMMEYYHADRLRYAVAGTPNLLEYDQGFFVKNGDGAADLKPIAHLYKTQVYQLAEYLDVPEVIRSRTPTTDTYPLEQTQEEFYFSLAYDKMDACLYAKNHDIPPSEVGVAIGLTAEQVQRVYEDIEAKRTASLYARANPLHIV
jgi:NAD+ synthase